MSLWWEVTAKNPAGNEASILVMGRTENEARENAINELSQTHPRVRVSITSIDFIADDENDEVVGGFDEKGALPRPEVARLTT